MTTATKTTKADGGASRDPAVDVERDLDGDGGNGAAVRDPGKRSAADGASKRDPAAKDTPKPFNRATAVADIIDELGDGTDASDETAADPDTGEADDQGGDEADDAKDADDSQDAADDADDAEADDESDEDDAQADDEKAEDADEDDDAEDETAEDDAATDEDAEKDPDVPDEAELAKYPKADRKRWKRVLKRMHDAEIQGKASRSIAQFAERNHMPPQVLQDWLVTGAKVINAKEPLDGALILADEVYALVADGDPGEASEADRAKALRTLADHLDPDGATPPTAEVLPEALADLVAAGVLTEVAARAAHAATKDKPAAKPTDAAKRQQRDRQTRVEDQRRSAYQRDVEAGSEAMKAEARIIAKKHPQQWPKIKAHIKAELSTTWKGTPPAKWVEIMRKETRLFLAEHAATRAKAATKPQPKPIRPSIGGRDSSKKGDDIDAILAED